MRLSRKMGLMKSWPGYPSLYELWSDATIVNVYGAHSSSLNRYQISVGDTSTPSWMIVSAGTSFEILKVKNYSLTLLNFGMAGEGSIYNGIYPVLDGTYLFIDTNHDDGLYGYALARLRFPSFSERVIDRMLGVKSFLSFDASQYSSSTASLYIADGSLSNNPDDVYLQIGAAASAGYFSVTRGGTPGTPIVSSGSIAFWRHNNSRYYWSTNGTSNSTTRVAGLYKMVLR